jgi:nicotinate phosphoribosyltransferase
MRDAPYVVLKLWQKLFGYKSLIMLDDAYGSDVFHKHLQRKYLEDFKGFRHDSGDPFAYGEAVIALYNSHGIDPRNKLIIFSDGLNPRKAIALMEHFRGRITSLKALSLVMKIMSAAGNPAVKLSNNLNKATGPTDEIEYYMKVFGYTNTASETVVY